MKRRCIVVGCGWAGVQHAQTVHDSEVAQLTALVEPNAQRALQMKERFGVQVYASLEDALERADFDTAVVATLPHLHARQCRLLLEHGKDVLCEKPLCPGKDEIAQLMDVARAHGVQLGVVFNQRYGCAVQRAKALLEEDTSPRQLITASMYQNFHVLRGEHIGEMFLLTDSCCHLLDLMTYLVGPVAEERAIGNRDERGVFVNVAATLRFAGGCVGTMAHSAYGGELETQHPFQQIEIHTQRARYVIDSLVDRLTVYPHANERREIYEPSVFERRDYGHTMTLACRDFLQALYRREPVPVPARDAWLNAAAIETLCASII